MATLNKSIWITWEKQVRNKSMASSLGSKLFELVYNGGRVKRYLICTYRTVLTLIKEKPRIVFAQNPSIFLTYVLIIARPLLRYILVADAHYAGIKACNNNNLLQKALDLCNRLVDLVIVTNNEHANWVSARGGKAIVVEDPLPDIGKYRVADADSDKKIILFICSFDVDEPYLEAFKAAERLSREGFWFRVTGNYEKAGISPMRFPYVEFLGYLPEDEFYANLFRCSVVLDLTENENCLVCGAYEAMAAERPLVTSDTECLRNYFTKGTLFTVHNEKNISGAVKKAYQERERLKKEIRAWKDRTYLLQHNRIKNINTELENMVNQ